MKRLFWLYGLEFIRPYGLQVYSTNNPSKYSFKVTLSAITESVKFKSKKGIKEIGKLLSKEVLNPSPRIEPRSIKRRARGGFGLLTIPRGEWKVQNGYS